VPAQPFWHRRARDMIMPRGFNKTTKATTISVSQTLADDAVQREPVSAPNSLLTGKNTGKFAKPRPSRRLHRFRNLDTPASSWSFPKESNREFWGRKQGNCCPEQGSLLDPPSGPLPCANPDREHVCPVEQEGPMLGLALLPVAATTVARLKNAGNVRF
jgi:hypothetical protein